MVFLWCTYLHLQLISVIYKMFKSHGVLVVYISTSTVDICDIQGVYITWCSCGVHICIYSWHLWYTRCLYHMVFLWCTYLHLQLTWVIYKVFISHGLLVMYISASTVDICDIQGVYITWCSCGVHLCTYSSYLWYTTYKTMVSRDVVTMHRCAPLVKHLQLISVRRALLCWWRTRCDKLQTCL